MKSPLLGGARVSLCGALLLATCTGLGGGALAASWKEQIEAEWLANPPGSVPKLSRRSNAGRISPRQDAAGAVDGVKNGGTGFHTNQDNNPWWQVDLGESRELWRVVVYNRNDCADRAARIMVLLSDKRKKGWRTVYRHNGTGFWGARDKKPLIVYVEGQKARFVRMQLPGHNYLHLDEVEVYGTENPKKNLALGRPAAQSSSSTWSTASKVRPVVTGPGAGPTAGTTEVKAAVELARKTLEFIGLSAARRELVGKLRAELAALEKEIAAAAEGGSADWKAMYLRTRWFRRRMIMSHPTLDFEKLLINRRPPTLYSHQCDQYLGRHSRVGPGLTVLSSWKDNPTEKVPLAGKLPPGCFHHPDLSYDAKRVLFSFCDHTETNRNYRRFWVYEAAIDGSWVKKLTGTPRDPLETWGGRSTVLIEDWDPCYLPDGGFAFISTRSQSFGRCHGGRYTPSYLLYRADAGGENIRQISFGEANEWDPAVLHDGRIVYTRWDYINRHDTHLQSLWSTRPDGTDTRHFYGNHTRKPTMTAEAQPIPGSHKVVSTAMAHHSYTSGSIIMLDRHKGEDGPDPLTRITPETSFPEAEGFPVGSFASPWPLGEGLYLAAYQPDRLASQGRVQQVNAYSIYLVDTLGGRELVYRDPEMSSWAPMPLRPRPMPPVVHSMVAGKRGQKTGVFWVQDVHRSTQPIPPGSIKAIRVNKIIGQPTARHPARSMANNEITKGILGYVPVEKDGSVMFRAPAGVPLQLQVLDENGMAVMTMRTLVYLHPGEVQSCVGCHEPRNVAAPQVPYPAARVPKDIRPAAGPSYEGGFRFVCTVQPVLDRHCIRCHGLGRTDGKLSLLGTPSRYNVAYESIHRRAGMIELAQRNRETDVTTIGQYFSHGGKLAKMLLAGHPDSKGKARVTLDKESFQRIVDWLDVNSQFYGDYSYNRVEQRRVSSEGEKALRAHVREMFGEEMSKQPLAALVNYALATESRILKAPLAADAGGWGQVTPVGSNGCWWSTEEAGYTKTLALVEKVFIPHEHKDVRGTCGRGDRGCRCGGCWVRKAEEAYRKSVGKPAEGKAAQVR